MRVLIIGSDTPVGKALHDFLLRRGRYVHVLAREDCRWKSERQAKKAVVRADCEFVVDTRLQAAADSGEAVRELDLKRTLWLARACQKNKYAYLYLSSARVFSGDVERLYTEEDFPDNTDTLGDLLTRAEQSVRDQCERHVVLRLGPVFSHSGVNILTHMLGQMMAGGSLLLENHLQGAPVPARDAARVVSGLMDQFSTGATTWGIYHYCSSDITNCYEFAETLLASASQFTEFSPSAVELVRHQEPRPQLSRALDCTRVRNTFAIKQTPWRGAIAGAVKLYFSSLNQRET